MRRALDPRLAERVQACARRESVDAKAIVHTAFSLVAARTSDSDDVVFGAGLNAPRPVRVRVDNRPARDVVAEVDRQLRDLPAGDGEFPLTVSVEVDADTICVGVTSALPLEPERVCDMLDTALESLAAALEQDSPAPVLALEVLPADERKRIVVEWNATARCFPADQPVHRLVERVCEEHGVATAIVHGRETVSFAELNASANIVARALVRAGVRPGDRVALRVPRSIALVVAELAVLKCGAAYVPIDEHGPAERQAFVVEDCGAQVVLEAAMIEALLASGEPEANLDIDVDGAATAYVMYTSGSTGTPKGCEIAHRSVSRLLINNSYAAFSARDRVAFVANPAFDASILEVWAPLLHGGRIVVVDHETLLDAGRFAAELAAQSVTILSLTVGLFNRYAAILGSLFARLDYLFVGGDVVNPAVIAEVMRASPPRHVIHAYGPTETTLFATTYEVRDVLPGQPSVPIGRPISNTTVYLLDRHGRPTPVGVTGEVYIGGPGVARGYLGRPALNAERFVPDPFAGDPHARLYRTGDLARYRADGNIEFLGRRDQQVKIRGYRVELGEIEARLAEVPGIDQAIVLARQESDDDKRLVAYYTVRPGVFADEVSAAALRAHLTAWLPAYMVPWAYVALAAVPLTPHGKVDRRALPEPAHGDRVVGAFEAPRSELERRLASLWSELLRVERIGRDDNFFALGGHSLLAMTMLDRLQRQGIHAPIAAFFAAPTLTNLAAAVVERGAAAVPPSLVPPGGADHLRPEMLPLVDLQQDELDLLVAQIPGGARNVHDVYPLSPLQEGILFHHLLSRRGDPYVLCSPVLFEDRTRLDAYLAALRALIERHDILRTSIHWEGLPAPVQVVWRHAPLVVEPIAVTGTDALAQLRSAYDPGRDRLDVRQAPLLRVLVAKDPASHRWVAMELLHHIASDHTTADMIRHELREHLAGRFASLEQPEPPRNFVASLRDDDKAAHEAYFRTLLGDVHEPTSPFGVSDVQGEGAGVVAASIELEPRLASRLRERARHLGVSTASVFHLAWSLVLARTSGKDDVVFGSVLVGRMQGGAGIARALGLFINTLPVRARLAEVSVERAVREMHGQLAALLRHESASLVLAQRCSGVRPPAPLFTALFNYFHDDPGPAPAADELRGITFLREDERTNYPLVLMVGDRGGGFWLKAQVVAPLDPGEVCALTIAALDDLANALESEPDLILVHASIQAARAAASPPARAYEEPIGDVERRVARLWAEVLSVERVGRNDDFFKLGGHSLLAVKVLDRMALEGLHGKLRALFSSSMLSTFARSVEAR